MRNNATLLADASVETQKHFVLPGRICLGSKCAREDSDCSSFKGPLAIFLGGAFYFKQTTAELGCMLVSAGWQNIPGYSRTMDAVTVLSLFFFLPTLLLK